MTLRGGVTQRQNTGLTSDWLAAAASPESLKQRSDPEDRQRPLWPAVVVVPLRRVDRGLQDVVRFGGRLRLLSEDNKQQQQQPEVIVKRRRLFEEVPERVAGELTV
ncbi:hypothetical protein EYF80_043868 [Liparis tanakae]|uniref:Uncharacterized protein n=1 Tax=Liparis tanakae TaxID=230148 RepID=A0A4Z2FXG3_9TELE|nr:hypothetical protein EYF80_043868 [Liparis tanakae]